MSVSPTIRSTNGTYEASPIQKTAGEVTGNQTLEDQHVRRAGFAGIVGESFFYGNGGTLENPMAFPGYGHLYTGTYETYRWMLCHPVLQLAKSICVGPIRTNEWGFESMIPGESIPENWLRALQANFNPIRPDLIDDIFVRGRDYGWASAEIVWDYEDGLQRVTKIKPLSHSVTDVLRDVNGNVVGVENRVSVGTSVNGSVTLPAPFKSLVYTFDKEYDDPYGRAWLENVRSTAWKMWLDAAQQLQRIGGKISGTCTLVTSPAGTFPGPMDKDGKPTQISYRDNAIEVIKALKEGAAGAWFPSIGLAPDSKGSIDAMKVLSELIGKSLTNVEVVDHSANAQALAPILAKMKHAEDLMFAGALRSSRTGLEGEHGTKAEAGIHTDTGTINADAEEIGFARQLQPLVDSFMILNFGRNAKGKVRIKPDSLVDRKKQMIRILLSALLNNTYVAEEMARAIDIDDMLRSIDINVRQPFSGEDVIKRSTADKQKQQPNAQEKKNNVSDPQGGRPSASSGE